LPPLPPKTLQLHLSDIESRVCTGFNVGLVQIGRTEAAKNQT
jgi:hypothetical protein